jgi:hypothetical protein
MMGQVQKVGRSRGSKEILESSGLMVYFRFGMEETE